jgi:hypothetical protein
LKAPIVPIVMSLQPWQRANILAAANYLRDLAAKTSGGRSGVIHQGLLEVLDPARRVTRLQREMANAAKAAATTGQERRAGRDRRLTDRRKRNVGRAAGDRRASAERRSGADRRNH